MAGYQFGDSEFDLLRKIADNGSSGGGGGGGVTTVTGTVTANAGTGTMAVNQTLSTSITTGTDVTVAVAGTAVQAGAGATQRGVVVGAPDTNTGMIYVGGSTVTNAGGARRGIILSQLGNSGLIPVDNANDIWINADTAGDKATITIL